MKDDNLPEINLDAFKKKEKKGGFLGWLRGAGGGGAGAAGSAGAGGAASGGLGAFIAGKIGAIVVLAVAAGTAVTYLNDSAKQQAARADALKSVSQATKAKQAEYVPAIVRSEQANKASSLALFSEKAKGSGFSLDETPKPAEKKSEQPQEAAASAEAPGEGAADEGAAQPDIAGMMEGATAGMGGPGGLRGNSLSSSLGGNSGKLSLSNKPSFGNQVGSGFAAMPKFNERQNKMLAMRGSGRPAFGKAAGVKTGSVSGGKSLRQAKGVGNRMATMYSASSIDAARSGMDKAWEGTTSTDGGEEMTVETSGAIDDISGAGAPNGPGGGSGLGTYTPPVFKLPCDCDKQSGQAMTDCLKSCDEISDVSPWAQTASDCNMYIMMSLGLSLAAAGLVKAGKALIKKGDALCAVNYTAAAGAALKVIGWILKVIGWILAAAAAAAAVYAGVLAVQLMSKHKQGWMGAIYGIGAVAALAGSAMAVFGKIEKVLKVKPGWVAGAAVICTTIAGLLGKN